MSKKLLGKKRGMIQLFNEDGRVVACTVIEVEPNVITQIKTEELDGYNAIQTGFEKFVVKDPRTINKRASKPSIGHYKKAKVDPRKFLMECKIDNVEDYSIGQEITVATFAEKEFVDVSAISIGKGYQGAMKLHNFAGNRASHGASKNHRSLGSTGHRSTPGRCFLGGKRACHMGAKRVTVQNIEVIKVDDKDNIIVLKGSVPGPKNCVVEIQKAKKKQVA